MATKRKKTIHKTIDALEADARKKNAHPPVPQYHDSGYQFRQRMVWATVGLIGVSVFGMWGWHMKTVLYDAARGSLGQKTPLDSAGAYFDEAMLIAGAGDEDISIVRPSITSSMQEALDAPNTKNALSATTTSSTLNALITTLQKEIPTTTPSSTSDTSPL